MNWWMIAWMVIVTIISIAALVSSSPELYDWTAREEINRLLPRINFLESKHEPTFEVKGWYYKRGRRDDHVAFSRDKPDGYYVLKTHLGKEYYSQNFLTKEEAEAVIKVPRLIRWADQLQEK